MWFDGYIKSLVVNWLHYLIIADKKYNNNGENPTWRQAMNDSFADEYLEAAVNNIETLESTKAWEVV